MRGVFRACRRHAPRLARSHGFPVLLYTLLALLLTWPLALQFATGVPGDGVDCWQNMWNMWWLKRALLEGHNPFYTTEIYYPGGASLLLHTLNPLNFVISLPLHALFGLVVAYNFALLFSLVASGYGAYLLAFDVTHDQRAALLAGAVFAFSGYMLAQALGHLNLIAAEWIPFSVLALHYAARKPSVKWIGLAGVCLALNVACDWQYFLFVLLWSGWYGVVVLWQARASGSPLRAVLPVAGAVVVALLLVLPVLLPTAELAARTPRADTGDSYRIGTSADVTDFFIPSQLHPGWRRAAAKAQVYKMDSIIHNKTAYLGMAALALAVIGLWPARRTSARPPNLFPYGNLLAKSGQEPRIPQITRIDENEPLAFWHTPLFWLLSMLVFVLMALGPVLQIGGSMTGIPLPAALFYDLPLVRISRVPIRFVVVVMLALAMLAAFGTRRLLLHVEQRVPRRPRLASGLLLAALIGLVVLDNFTAPYPMVGVYVPPVYVELGAEEGEYAILEMPFYERTSVIYMFYQAVHGKPMVGGNLSRFLPYPLLDRLPVMRMFAYADSAPDIVGFNIRDTAASIFSYFDIRYLILHSEGGALRYNTTVKVARAAAGGADPRYIQIPGRSFQIYRVQEPAEPLPFLGVGTGWTRPEPYVQGAFLRHIQDEGELLVYSAVPQEVRLDIRLHSEQAGTLHLTTNGEPLPPVQLAPGVQHIEVVLEVAPGMSSLRLRPAGAGDVAVERAVVE
jgi:hypothetical protein